MGLVSDMLATYMEVLLLFCAFGFVRCVVTVVTFPIIWMLGGWHQTAAAFLIYLVFNIEVVGRAGWLDGRQAGIWHSGT